MIKLNSIFLTLMCAMLFCACGMSSTTEVSIIPRPVDLKILDGHFTLTAGTTINIVSSADDLTPACDYFKNLLEKSLGTNLATEQGDAKSNAINIIIDPTMKSNAYELDVNKKSIDIKAGSSRGVFYAFQTLRQMLPTNIEKGEKITSVNIQNVFIQDEPRFEHRGVMVDVCRHFFTVDEIKTIIDMLALHKMNRFHWHLTDDQGWRIEIKKYPELTNIGSRRSETVIGRNSGEYDGKPHGGFYTQDEIKDVVKYAADRYITIIPEIEIPGHATAALASYPELGCTGGPYEVIKEWGIFNDVFCAGNEKVFEFLEGVLDEVIPLFPSEYIHIGGDECPKTAWKKCPKCQSRIRKEGLKDEMALQSYVIHRIENYLNTKGKKIIGWEEIAEGGLSPTATVMSWKGVESGIEAAKSGNSVIMSPSSYLYLNYYQSRDREKEPLAIGGFVDIAKVYSLNPTEGLTPEEAQMVIGVQGNIWTEYIPDLDLLQYMLLPRMAALAEISWLPDEKKDYSDFTNRASILTERYEALGYNYAKHILSVYGQASVNEDKKCLEIKLLPQTEDSQIRFTTDNSQPSGDSPLYTSPVEIRSDTELKAQLFKNGQPVGSMYSAGFKVSNAAFKDIQLLTKLSGSYSGKGGRTLTDGQRGSSDYQDGKWIATQDDDIAAVIDFGKETAYNLIHIGTIQERGSWIYLPQSITAYSSADGKEFKEIAKITDIEQLAGMDKDGLKTITLNIENSKSRFVKIITERLKFLPKGHESAGKPAFIFMDEIEVY